MGAGSGGRPSGGWSRRVRGVAGVQVDGDVVGQRPEVVQQVQDGGEQRSRGGLLRPGPCRGGFRNRRDTQSGLSTPLADRVTFPISHPDRSSVSIPGAVEPFNHGYQRAVDICARVLERATLAFCPAAREESWYRPGPTGRVVGALTRLTAKGANERWDLASDEAERQALHGLAEDLPTIVSYEPVL